MEISFEYWNRLADQTILISSLLCGFSIAILANFLVASLRSRLTNYILVLSTCAAGFLLISVFAMTKLLLLTTQGYPFPVVNDDLFFPRIVGSCSFFLGIFSLISVISLSGWTRSKRLGRITTLIGLLTLICLLVVLY
ncbi:hypothetical protein [Nonlabens xiamenensis]|uniref:hypothetical protein n=1 Tax=Nonlabens xiamenensis TaxID=2341043 RepID=UPI000F60F433|nr:hypothetical protein [Nonlabens xiamenensis]